MHTSQSRTSSKAEHPRLARRRERGEDATPLFRPAAAQAAREPLHGQVTVAMPPSAAVAAVASLLAVLLLGVAAFVVEIPQRTRAVGVLMPRDGFMKVVASDAGQVIDVRVREGEEVGSGQPLIILGSRRGVIGPGPVSESQLRSLQSERSLSEEAHHERQRIQRQRVDALDQQLGNVGLRMELIDREIAIQQSRVSLLRSRFERLLGLAVSGNVSEVQLDDEKLLLLQGEAASAVVQQQAVQIAAERDQLLRTRSVVVEEAAVQQLEFAVASEQLQRQIAGLEAEVSRELRAPEDGVVARLTVRPGQAVHPGQTLMTLHRRGKALQAWLYLSSANAGMLERGQRVELRLDAWPHRVFGTRSATIASISRIALLPSELDVPLAITGPVFEVRATLDRQRISAGGKEWPLAAGTSFQADIVQRRYRLYEWLLRLRQDGTVSAASADA